jgi:hypothetical protein
MAYKNRATRINWLHFWLTPRSGDNNSIPFEEGPDTMPRTVRCSLIQAANVASPETPITQIKAGMIEKHLGLIRQAAEAGAQIVCLQEIFTGPYFCAEQQIRWYDAAEEIPAGPTIELMRDVARRHRIALIVPIYEREQEGVYYNTAAVIHNDGSYLGKYRKTHIPHVAPGFWEKFYFRPGNLGYPVFDLGFAKTPRSSSIPRPRWPASASISGSSSNPRTPWPTAISSEPSIA